MDLIDSLVRYVKEIKPFHTKIYGVDVEYRAIENLNVSFKEDLQMNIWLGMPLRDLTNFGWTIDELNYPDDVDISQYVKYRGWDTSDWEEFPWDLTTVLGEPFLVKSGLMYENVIVSMTESLQFNFSPFSGDQSCQIVIPSTWDPSVDGITVLGYTSTSIILDGDVTEILNMLQTNGFPFEIEGSDINDGTYGIIFSSFDVLTSSTTVTVSINPNASGSGGLAKFSYWNSAWTESLQTIVTSPPGDVCAQTHFGESLTITLGISWDFLMWVDNTIGGWDNNILGGWDNYYNDYNGHQYVASQIDIQAAYPPTTDQTDNRYWKNDPLNTIEYVWGDFWAEKHWFHEQTSSVWEFALIPKSDSPQVGVWTKDLRASVLRISMDSGPDESNGGFLMGNVMLYDTANNQVGSSPFTFANYNERITIDIPIDNSANLDYGRLLFETFLYTTGPRIYLMEFDPV